MSHLTAPKPVFFSGLLAALVVLLGLWGVLGYHLPPLTMLTACVLAGILVVARRYRLAVPAPEEASPELPTEAPRTQDRTRLYTLFGATVQNQTRQARRERPLPPASRVPHFGGGFICPQGDPLADPPPPPAEPGSLRWSLETLGISPEELDTGGLTQESIARRYKEKSRIWHPDRHRHADENTRRRAHEQMADLNLAKSVLSGTIHGETR